MLESSGDTTGWATLALRDGDNDGDNESLLQAEPEDDEDKPEADEDKPEADDGQDEPVFVPIEQLEEANMILSFDEDFEVLVPRQSRESPSSLFLQSCCNPRLPASGGSICSLACSFNSWCD